MAIYYYSTSTQIDAITLLNHLSMFFLYNVFLRTLNNIKFSIVAFIKKQTPNFKLMSIWDNFKYKKNVVGEKFEDIIKFISIIIAL